MLADIDREIVGISIHALREESDIAGGDTYTIIYLFLSTLSVRRATLTVNHIDGNPIFLSTLSVRRATYIQAVGHCQHSISIHALREESDPRRITYFFRTKISIHALREESDIVNKNMVAHPL
mgnify:CR=1 FL=1